MTLNQPNSGTDQPTAAPAAATLGKQTASNEPLGEGRAQKRSPQLTFHVVFCLLT